MRWAISDGSVSEDALLDASPATAIVPAPADETGRAAPRTSWQVLLFVAVAVLITGVAIALAVHAVRSDGSRSTKTTTGRSSPVTTAGPAPSSAVVQTSTTTSLAVRAAPSVLSGCRQDRPGTLVVTGQASDPSGRARRYRVEVALGSETGAKLTTATQVVVARPGGRPTAWTIRLPVGNLAGRKVTCQLVSVDALPS